MVKRKKASASTRARLKALRKKHKLGEFKPKSRRSVRSAPRTIVKTTRRKARKTMVKRRKRVTRRAVMGGLQKPLIAGITYAFVQPFASQLLQRFNIGLQDELAQILLAVVAKRMIRNPIVNNWANAAIIVNTASLASGFASKLNLGGVLQNNSTGTSVSGVSSDLVIG